MKWRIKEIFSPKHNMTLYIPQYKGLFFYSSFTYHEFRECIEHLHNMCYDFELVWEFPDNRMGFKTIKRAKDMIGYYKEHCKIVAEHEKAEKEARKKARISRPNTSRWTNEDTDWLLLRECRIYGRGCQRPLPYQVR